jgi:hypothetical protein
MTLTGVGARLGSFIWLDRETPWAIPKYILKPKPEAVDFIVPLVPDLVPIVQGEPLDLTHKVFERVRTMHRKFWLIRAPRTSEVGRHKR